MTSSTVCALAAKEKNVMAAGTRRKKQKTLENSLDGASRKSTFMNSPKSNGKSQYTNGSHHLDAMLAAGVRTGMGDE
jgi:hypothetical protein